MGGAQQTLTPAGEGPRGAYRRGTAFVGTWLVPRQLPSESERGVRSQGGGFRQVVSGEG